MFSECIERDEEATQQVSDSQGVDDQIESLYFCHKKYELVMSNILSKKHIKTFFNSIQYSIDINIFYV